MATHSSVLAWRTPGTGEPDGLPSMGSHRVGHDVSDLAAAAAAQPCTYSQQEGRSHAMILNSNKVNLKKKVLKNSLWNIPWLGLG